MDQECTDQQAAYLEGDDAAGRHVRACPVCAPLVPELDEIRAVLSDPDVWDEPGDDLEARIVHAVQEAGAPPSISTSTLARATPAQEAPPSTERTATVVSLDARRARQGIGRHRTVMAAAAAAVVAAALTGTAMRALDRPPSADATFALAATDLAPDVEGEVEIRSTPSGYEIRLRAERLPRAPEGFFYQAWLNGEKGSVTIGTFHTGGDDVVLWSGVSPWDYPGLTVTLEAEDGDVTSSGEVLLRAEVQRDANQP